MPHFAEWATGALMILALREQARRRDYRPVSCGECSSCPRTTKRCGPFGRVKNWTVYASRMVYLKEASVIQERIDRAP